MQISSISPQPQRLNVVTIPQDAPEKVKQIMDVQFTLFGDKVRIDPQKLLNKKLQIAQKIQENGYNPSDYHLNIENINQHLQHLQATKDYQQLLETTEENINSDIRYIDSGDEDIQDFLPFAMLSGFFASPAFITLSELGLADPMTKFALLMYSPVILIAALTGAGALAGFGQSVTSTIKLLVDKCKLRKYKSLTPTHPVIEKAVSKLKKEAPKLARL